MAMPKTGSRRIIVDGCSYLWRVRRSPTYSQANGWAPLRFTVQYEDGGATLLASCTEPRPDNWLDQPGAVITPHLVADVIRRAITAGWKPLEQGPTFKLPGVEAGLPGGAKPTEDQCDESFVSCS
jgi:hypothetical protein